MRDPFARIQGERLDELVGRSLGPRGQYRLTALLGRGGMGAVYRAEQTALQREVAVKIINPWLTAQPDFIRRFEQEARTLARLEHGHILPVYDFGEEEGLFYLVMRLVSGGALKDRLADTEPLAPAQALVLARQVLPALDYAHEQGVVHRDLKPGNILMQGDWAFLADFGVAKLIQGEQGLTGYGVVVGTPEYMAPEQVLGLPLDGRADLYAFGVILYQALTGRVPFQADSPMAVALEHVQAPLPAPRELNPAVSEALAAVLVRALAKERDQRYPTGAEFVAALEQAIAPRGHLAAPAAGAAPEAPTLHAALRPPPVTARSADATEQALPIPGRSSGPVPLASPGRQPAEPAAAATPSPSEAAATRPISAMTPTTAETPSGAAPSAVPATASTSPTTPAEPAAPRRRRRAKDGPTVEIAAAGPATPPPTPSDATPPPRRARRPRSGRPAASDSGELQAAGGTFPPAGPPVPPATPLLAAATTATDGGVTPVASAEPVRAAPAARTERRNPVWAIGGAAALVVLIGVALFTTGILAPFGGGARPAATAAATVAAAATAAPTAAAATAAAPATSAPPVAVAPTTAPPVAATEAAPAATESGAATPPATAASETTAAPLVAPPSTSPEAPLTEGRALARLVALPDGSLLIAGGKDGARYLATAERFDPNVAAWRPAAAMRTARSGHTATVLKDGRVLVAGGQASQTAFLDSAEIYDPTVDAWSPAGTLATARAGHTATLLADGRVLVTGGNNSSGFLASAEIFDPRSNTWSSAGEMASDRRGHTATLLPDGKVLVVGGFGSNAEKTTELYDPTSNQWQSAGKLDDGRVDHSATLLKDGRVLVAGGSSSANGGTFNASAVLYDPASGAWSPAAPMAAARAGHEAVLLPDGQVLAIGGRDASGPIAGVERYDPAANTWTQAAAMSAPRWLFSAGLLPNGRLLAAGGLTDTDSLKSVEFYDPAANTWSASGAAQQTLTLTLASQNDSGITGTVTMTELGSGKLRIEFRTQGSGATARPAHIHHGSCANLQGGPAYTLAPVINDTSTTVVDGSLQQLLAAPFAVHMHKSSEELTTYVACANIER